MSDSFYIVNINKKQYISPMIFGDYEGPNGYLKGRHATAAAILACEQPSDRWPVDCALAGSWNTDRIVAAFCNRPPNTHGLVTATADDPGRNLYQMTHEEFEDISHLCIIMICDWLEFAADDMAQMAAGDPFMLFHLGAALELGRCESLEKAIAQHVGTDWRAAFEEARRLVLDL